MIRLFHWILQVLRFAKGFGLWQSDMWCFANSQHFEQSQHLSSAPKGMVRIGNCGICQSLEMRHCLLVFVESRVVSGLCHGSVRSLSLFLTRPLSFPDMRLFPNKRLVAFREVASVLPETNQHTLFCSADSVVAGKSIRFNEKCLQECLERLR